MKNLFIIMLVSIMSICTASADIYRSLKGDTNATWDVKNGICTYSDYQVNDVGTYVMSTLRSYKYFDLNTGTYILMNHSERSRPFVGISTTYINDLFNLPNWIKLEVGFYVGMSPYSQNFSYLPYGVQLGIINIEW